MEYHELVSELERLQRENGALTEVRRRWLKAHRAHQQALHEQIEAIQREMELKRPPADGPSQGVGLR